MPPEGGRREQDELASGALDDSRVSRGRALWVTRFALRNLGGGSGAGEAMAAPPFAQR